MLLSVFCGPGGLDLGFEQAGFQSTIAVDSNPACVSTYNSNRKTKSALVADIRKLTLNVLDGLFGGEFSPIGVIGGPPCQSFSIANQTSSNDDPRHELPLVYASLLRKLNTRHPLHFFVFENVTGLLTARHKERYAKIRKKLEQAGFNISESIIRSLDYGVPQKRERLIIVGFNKSLYGDLRWIPPVPHKVKHEKLTVRSAIGSLPEPVYFARDLTPNTIPFHPNHWCMTPKSSRFKSGALKEGESSNRSFKTLAWDKPSLTVAYGNREVHVHPSCTRRLSVLEAMLLQGFPKSYRLKGTLSEQIQQVSDAVPPPVAKMIARSIIEQLGLNINDTLS